jgi:hypothetical protein
MVSFRGLLFRKLSRSQIRNELFKDLLEALNQSSVTHYLQNVSLLVSELISYGFQYKLNDRTDN